MVKNIADQFGYPPRYINAYLYTKLSEYDLNLPQNTAYGLTPFFARTPLDISSIYNDLEVLDGAKLPLVFTYDRMLRFRPNSFYVHKREQLLYIAYGSVDDVINASQVIQGILDREDAAAQDLNRWMYENQNLEIAKKKGVPEVLGIPKIFFRNIKVYQADESRDVVEQEMAVGGRSARPIYANKFIVEYDYHVKDNAEFLESNAHSIKATEHIDSTNA
jgi:hypothetical protein